MSLAKMFTKVLISALLVVIMSQYSKSAPYPDLTMVPGAIAGTSDDGGAIAIAGGPVSVVSPSGSISSGQLTRSGGSGSSKLQTQSILVGSSNGGDTTVIQQSGSQPAKVYKITG